MIDFTLTTSRGSSRARARLRRQGNPPGRLGVRQGGTSPQAIIEKAHEVGLMNAHVPEEYGGPGLSYLDGCLIEEEISVGLLGHRHVARRQRPGGGAGPLGGSEEVKKTTSASWSRGRSWRRSA